VRSGFCADSGCERRGNAVGSAGLSNADVCDYAKLKPCQDLLCEGLTFTASVVLHVRTNGGFRGERERERNSVCQQT